MSTNNYKPDAGKPPVRSAVLIPFRHALLALARMMQGQIERHKLTGAKDPFQEWAQLPDAEKRLHEAQARHTLFPDLAINPDSGESHELHDLWNILAVVELQERAKLGQPAKPAEVARYEAPDPMCICGHKASEHTWDAGHFYGCAGRDDDPSHAASRACRCPEFREE